MDGDTRNNKLENKDNIWEGKVEYCVWFQVQEFDVRVDKSTLKDEREHLERSLSERFSFFLVWVGLITAAAFAVDSSRVGTRVSVLIFGSIVAAPLFLVLYMTKLRLDWVLTLLKEAFQSHAARQKPPELESWSPKAGIINLIGLIIPLICVLGLLAGARAISLGWL